jgi:hypothetical protein
LMELRLALLGGRGGFVIDDGMPWQPQRTLMSPIKTTAEQARNFSTEVIESPDTIS